MTKSNEVALVPVEQYALMQYNMNELSEVIKDNLGGDGIQVHELDTIKIPSGGVTAWAVPGLDGEDEMKKEIDGVIIHWKSARAYWEKSLDETGGGTEPDCQSQDGQWGVKREGYEGKVGGDCSKCPFSQYGSATKGNGQACKESRVLFMLNENAIIPFAVRLAPTSIKPIRQFMMRLTSHGVHYSAVRVRLMLEKAENNDGIKYAKVKPVLGERLTPEQAAKVREYAAQIKPILDSAIIDMTETEVRVGDPVDEVTDTEE